MVRKLFNRIWEIIPVVNRVHKDKLFCYVFGKEKYKKYALALYNAINKSNYTNQSDLEIITLENVVYLGVKNDVAYLLSGRISLYEHQSSINPNMPVRGLIYIGELYSKLLMRGRNKRRLYGSSLVKIPTPQYVVFYNGKDDYPEVSKLRLSDAFVIPRDDGEFEFTATVYNINPGMNDELLNSCEPLREYCVFIERIRKNEKYMTLEEAVSNAINSCIKDGILADVLSEERNAVMRSILTITGFTEKEEREYQEELREEARAEGRAEGLAEGRAEGRAEGLAEGRTEERHNTEMERRRADAAEALVAKYKEKYGDL